MDKAAAQILVFGGDGRCARAPGLFLRRGRPHRPRHRGPRPARDPRPRPHHPAGRFVGGYGPSIDAGRVLWVDYDSAVSMTATGVPEETSGLANAG